VNEAGIPIASLRPDDVHRMYQLLKPEVYMKKQFLDTFRKENPNLVEIIKYL